MLVDDLVQNINEMGSWFSKDNSRKLKIINRDIFFLKNFVNTLTLAEKSDSSGSAFFPCELDYWHPRLILNTSTPILLGGAFVIRLLE